MSQTRTTGWIGLATLAGTLATATVRGEFVMYDMPGSQTPDHADTVLGVFNEGGNKLLAMDDDSSMLGNGFASALYGMEARPSRWINWKVSGFTDRDFDSFWDGTAGDSDQPHSISGLIEMHVTFYDEGYLPILTLEPVVYELNGMSVLTGQLRAPSGTKYYDLVLSNDVLLDSTIAPVPAPAGIAPLAIGAAVLSRRRRQ